MNPAKRKMDAPPEPSIVKKAVSQSTVTTNEFLCVIYQATRPGTPGKVYANVGMRTNEDARFSKMATMVVFPGPSEMTAQISEPGAAPCCTVELRLHGLMTDGSPDSSQDFLNSHHH
jgi:hypothetical protein